MIKNSYKNGVSALVAALVLAGCTGQSPDKSINSAKALLAKGDDKAAVIELKNALQKDASSAEARFLLGSALVAGGNMRDAAIELNKAKELGYSAAKIAPKMAQALIVLGQFEKIVADYASVQLESTEDMADLQISVASAYAALGKAAEAQTRINAAISAAPDNLRAQFTRVRFLASFEGMAAALKAIDETLSKVPKSAEAWQVKGDLLNYIGQHDEAVAAFRQSVQLDGSSYAAHTGLMTQLLLKKDLSGAEKELEALKKLRPNVPTTRRFTAALALEKGELKTAVENIQEVLKVTPNDINVLHLAGAIEFKRGNLLQAEAHLSKALSEAPFISGIRVLLARTQARGGDYTKALQVLQPLMGEQSTKLDALTIAAEICLQQGDAQRAATYLGQALKLNPGDKRSQTAMAVAQIGKGNLDQGFAELKRISAENPDFILPDMLLVTTYLQKSRFELALAAVESLQKKTPNQPIAPSLRGVIEAQLGHKENARKAFEAAISIDPVYLPSISNLAALEVGEGKIEAAIKRYQAVIALQPDNITANMAVIALQEKQGVAASTRAEELKKLTKRLPADFQPRVALVRLELDRGDVKAALTAAQDATAALPDRPEVWAALGQAQKAGGDFNQAFSAYNKVATLQPNSPEHSLRLAELYAAKKDRAGMLQQLKKALSIKGDYLPAQLALLSAYHDAKNYSDARGIAKTVQQQRPGESIGQMLEGDIESSQKNWVGAITAYQAGLAKAKSPELTIKLHRALTSAGKTVEAQRVQNGWLANNPTDAMVLYYLGNSATRNKDFEMAEKYYRGIVKIQPDHALAINNIAWLMNQMKKPGALQYAEKANALVPNQPAFMDTLAEIYAGEGQLEKALEIQKRAVALDSQTPEQRLHLARLYIATGNRVAARAELTKLADLGYQFSQQAEVSRLMSGL